MSQDVHTLNLVVRPFTYGEKAGRHTAKILLLDMEHQHAEALAEYLQSQNLPVGWYDNPEAAMGELRRSASEYEIVIVNVSTGGISWHRILRKLHLVCRRVDAARSPLFLCVSHVRQQPQFVLQIERTGARYVREL
jgi:hypothetical protein